VKLEFKIGYFHVHMHTQRVFFWGGGGILTGIFGYNIPRMGEKKLLETFCLANYEGKRPLGKFRYKRGIISQWFLNRNGGCGLDSSGSEQSSVMGCRKDMLEPSCSIKFGDFFHQVSSC
jgi:hypothetical protein